MIAGIRPELIQERADIYRFLLTGSANRSSGSTLMNEHSSRSHAIFSILMQRRNANGKYMKSKFHLVDLAGSERVKKTGATGGRFRVRRAMY